MNHFFFKQKNLFLKYQLLRYGKILFSSEGNFYDLKSLEPVSQLVREAQPWVDQFLSKFPVLITMIRTNLVKDIK